MTDIITGNQIDIAAFDSGMSNPYKEDSLRYKIREQTSRLPRFLNKQYQRIPEDVRDFGEGMANVVVQGAFGEGGLLRSDMNPLGLQPVDALRAVDAVTTGVSDVTGIDKGFLEAAELAIPFVPKGSKIASKVKGRLIDEATDLAFRTADPESVAGMAYRTGGGVNPVPKHLIEKPRDVIGLKQDILTWYKQELQNRNLEVKDYHKIKREQFGDINVAGSDREISQIGKALKADDPSLMSLPKKTTRRKGRLKRTKETAAPEIKELHAFADEVGIPATTEDLLEFKKWATTSFKSVQDAAKKNSRFRGEYHAGHTTAAQSKTLTAQALYREGKLGRPATAGSSATIELGVDNIRGSNRAIHDINPIAAREAGVPTTWAETFKQWWKIKQGQPQKSYFTDFTNAERQIIESIPYNAKRSEVMKTFDSIYKNRQATNPDLSQYSAWSKDIKRGVEETFTDLRFKGF
jgi:hypothetical protein